MNTEAAHNLLGITLQTGWKVIKKLEKSDKATGSFFSVCYLVEKNGQVAFLKAFDFAKFFQIKVPGQSIVDIVKNMVDAYQYERNLSNHCKKKNIKKVSLVIDSGEENLSGFTISTVPYLIFDLADGDIRKKLDFSLELDLAWRIRSLHDVAVGLRQLHAINISHQDLKPSNVLIYNTDSKIGDLGRSICKDLSSPYDSLEYSGDYSYAPPEILYGYYEKDWHNRVFAIDSYLLGSLVVFYFCGTSMSALISKYTPDNFRCENWQGEFETVKPYLLNAFSSALNEFEGSVSLLEIKNDLRWIVEKLCYPLPEKRGHPKNVTCSGSNYNLERFISKLNFLSSKAKLALLQASNDKHILE